MRACSLRALGALLVLNLLWTEAEAIFQDLSQMCDGESRKRWFRCDLLHYPARTNDQKAANTTRTGCSNCVGNGGEYLLSECCARLASREVAAQPRQFVQATQHDAPCFKRHRVWCIGREAYSNLVGVHEFQHPQSALEQKRCRGLLACTIWTCNDHHGWYFWVERSHSWDTRVGQAVACCGLAGGVAVLAECLGWAHGH